MKYLLAITAITVLLTCCQPTERKIVLGEKYTEAWNSKNPGNVAAFYDDQAMLVVNGDSLKGKLSVINFAKSFMRNFPNMKLTMDSLVADNEGYSYYWSFRGNYEGPYGNGNRIVSNGFEKWILNEEGLIEVSIGTFDEKDFRKQMNAKKEGE